MLFKISHLHLHYFALFSKIKSIFLLLVSLLIFMEIVIVKGICLFQVIMISTHTTEWLIGSMKMLKKQFLSSTSLNSNPRVARSLITRHNPWQILDLLMPRVSQGLLNLSPLLIPALISSLTISEYSIHLHIMWHSLS